MLVTKIFAVAFATLVAAESTETQHEARGNLGATLYGRDGFRGASRLVGNGRCTDLRGPLRDNVHSIRVEGRSDCFLYYQENCRGAPTRYERSDRNIRFHRVRSARCVRDRRR